MLVLPRKRFPVLVLPRKRSVIQLFESQYFYDSVCGDLRAHFGAPQGTFPHNSTDHFVIVNRVNSVEYPKFINQYFHFASHYFSWISPNNIINSLTSNNDQSTIFPYRPDVKVDDYSDTEIRSSTAVPGIRSSHILDLHPK